jgi:hypothetical protein
VFQRCDVDEGTIATRYSNGSPVRGDTEVLE